MSDWGHQLQWNAIAYAIVAAVTLMAILGLWLHPTALRRPWLPLSRLRPGYWTGYDLFLTFCVEVGFPALILVLLAQIGFFNPLIGSPPGRDAPVLEQAVYTIRASYISSPLAMTVTLGMILTMMFARSRTRPQHYGLSWARWPTNLALGIVAFLVARPVVIGIFAIAVLVFPEESKTLERLGQEDLPPWEWLLFGFQMTVMAPVLEEITFRGLLQGWLRRASMVGHGFLLIWILFFASHRLVSVDAEQETVSINWSALTPIVLVCGAVTVYLVWMSRLKRRFDLDEDELRLWQVLPRTLSLEPAERTPEQTAEMRREFRQKEETRMKGWAEANANLAILGSALLFAVFHPWPGSLALFPMGLLLGWMSRRTQSLVGPIVFHSLFNLTTFIGFYGSALTAPR